MVGGWIFLQCKQTLGINPHPRRTFNPPFVSMGPIITGGLRGYGLTNTVGASKLGDDRVWVKRDLPIEWTTIEEYDEYSSKLPECPLQTVTIIVQVQPARTGTKDCLSIIHRFKLLSCVHGGAPGLE